MYFHDVFNMKIIFKNENNRQFNFIINEKENIF